MKKSHLQSKGLSAIIVTLIVSSVALLMATTATISGIQEAQIGLRQMRSKAILAAAEGCAEEGLLKLHQNSSYSGETMSSSYGSCIITVSGSGSTRTVHVSAVEADYTRALQIDVNISTPFQITNWQEN